MSALDVGLIYLPGSSRVGRVNLQRGLPFTKGTSPLGSLEVFADVSVCHSSGLGGASA